MRALHSCGQCACSDMRHDVVRVVLVVRPAGVRFGLRRLYRRRGWCAGGGRGGTGKGISVALKCAYPRGGGWCGAGAVAGDSGIFGGF